jgi:Ni/Co efflux regulator RcnB
VTLGGDVCLHTQALYTTDCLSLLRTADVVVIVVVVVAATTATASTTATDVVIEEGERERERERGKGREREKEKRRRPVSRSQFSERTHDGDSPNRETRDKRRGKHVCSVATSSSDHSKFESSRPSPLVCNPTTP